MINSFSKKIIENLSWNTFGEIISQIVNYSVLFLLLKCIQLDLLGIFILLESIVALFMIFGDLGLSAALIQKKSTETIHYNSVFWLNLFFGSILYIFFYYYSIEISEFFEEPFIESIIPYYCTIFLFSPFTLIQKTILKKQLEFKKLFYGNLITTIIVNAVVIILIIVELEMWALVFLYTAPPIIDIFYFYYAVSWKPNSIFSIKALRNLFTYGFNHLGISTLMIFSQKVDDILIGKVFGSGQLALYNIAYRILLMPTKLIKNKINAVFFPLFTSIQDDISLQRSIYIKATALTALLYFPLIIGFYFLSDEILFTFLGNKWVDANELIKIFCFGGFWYGIGYPGIVLKTNEEGLKLLFKLTVLNRFILIILILIGVFYFKSLHLTAWSVAISFMINSLILNYYALKRINLPVINYFFMLTKIISLSFSIIIVTYIYDMIVINKSIIHLTIKIMTIVLIYFSVFFIMKPFPYIQIKKFFSINES